MPEYDIIKIKVQKNSKELILKRTKRIEEALLFESGTIENRKRHSISFLPNQKESYFLKPGKETLRSKPNLFDMTPNVGSKDMSETLDWQFERIWEYLIKISIINQITFKKILVLLYRNCFMLDHIEIEAGKIRYSPSIDLADYITKIDFSLRDGFKDKFKTEELGLWEYLHFIDLLGWNEDVKYHIKNAKPDFETVDNKTGRTNTILSIICAPLMISNFIQDVIQKTQNHEVIDVKLITSTIQKFTKTRGICVLSNKALLNDLSPYLEK